LLGMAHRDIPPWNQVTHNPGSTGCPKRFQFREIIRTLPGHQEKDGREATTSVYERDMDMGVCA